MLWIDGPAPNGFTDWHESLSRIERRENGDFSFAVGSYRGWWVHYLGNGRQPQPSTSTSMGITISSHLRYVDDLGDGWYLAYYDYEVVEK